MKKMVNNSFLSVPSPKNLSFFWNMGSMLFFIYFIQILSGILLSMFFINFSNNAFMKIEFISFDINMGMTFRLIHLTTASLFFLFIYFHLFRGNIYQSNKFKNTWVSGVTIFILLMLVAFTGYVLPWGQMSFWAATVIIQFLMVVPFFGKKILLLLWSDVGVGGMLLSTFFSFHFLLPMIMLLLIFFHFAGLHYKGSSSKMSMSFFFFKKKFFPYFLLKDFLNFIFILFYLNLILFIFFLTGEDENFWVANPKMTPLHIKPEWYFLSSYAILRSIPNKLMGVILMILSVAVWYFLVFFFLKINKKNFLLFFSFFSMFLFLMYIGMNPVTEVFTMLGLLFGFIYFILIFFMMMIMIIYNSLF